MRRSALAALTALLLPLLACGSDPQDDPGPIVEPPTGECAAGELPFPDDTGCRAAGIAAEQCADGFDPDDAGGCVAILPPVPCDVGMMALPGETECREVAPCGEGRWGDIPVSANTQHVDVNHAGGDSDGSADRPWTSIGEAYQAATPGAVVAVAAGEYVEDVIIQGTAVQLWGRCPSMVEIRGSAGGLATVWIRNEAEGTVVRGVALTGPQYGLASSGSTDVLAEQIWVHHTQQRGVLAESMAGPTELTLRGSLVESAQDVGVMSYGATLTVESTVVRDTAAGSGFGRGLVARHGAAAMIRSCVIERNRDTGIVVAGATATLDASVVRETRSDATGQYGGGVTARLDSDTLERATITISGSSLVANGYYGFLLEGSDATVERTVVRDTLPQDTDGVGVGIQAQPWNGPATLAVVDSTVERNHYGGISVMGSTATVESTIVRDTLARPVEQDFGRGVMVYYDLPTQLEASATISGSVVERNLVAGIFAAAATLEVDRTHVRDTLPRLSDALRGRGISIHSQDELGLPSTVTIRRSLVERSHESGVLVEGSTATIEDTIVRDTREQQLEGVFGDNITVVAMVDHSTAAAVTIARCEVASGPRVGIASFGGLVTLSDSSLQCNAIDLNGMDTHVGLFEFVDHGGNTCGCGGEVQDCRVLTDDLAAPPPAIPTL